MVDFHRIRLPCDGVTVIRLSPTANDVIPAYFEGPRRRVYMQYHIDDNTRGITAIVVSRELMRAIREMDQSRSRDLQKVIVCGLDRSSKVADNESILSGTIDALKQMKKHVAAVRQRR